MNVAPERVKRVVLNELQRCGWCDAVVEGGVHVDSGRTDCAYPEVAA